MGGSSKPQMKRSLFPPKGRTTSSSSQRTKTTTHHEGLKKPETPEGVATNKLIDCDMEFEKELLSKASIPKIVHSPIDKENVPKTPHSEWSPIRRKKPLPLEDESIRCTKYTHNN
jgi:hypothetical protein